MSYAPVQGFGGGAVESKITKTNGTFSLPNGITEQDMLEFVGNDDAIVVTLDGTNLLQTTTITVQEKIDGINYRIIQSKSYPADFSSVGVKIALDGKGRDQKITLQSSIAEGSAKNVPHSRVEVLRST